MKHVGLIIITAVHWQYSELHCEVFAGPLRKLFSDVLLQWRVDRIASSHSGTDERTFRTRRRQDIARIRIHWSSRGIQQLQVTCSFNYSSPSRDRLKTGNRASECRMRFVIVKGHRSQEFAVHSRCWPPLTRIMRFWWKSLALCWDFASCMLIEFCKRCGFMVT